MNETKDWPGSILDKAMLVTEIGRFLRTHRGGDSLLMDWLASIPADRTEEAFAQEQKQAAEKHQAAAYAALDAHNKGRVSLGLPAIDKHGNPIPETGESVQ